MNNGLIGKCREMAIPFAAWTAAEIAVLGFFLAAPRQAAAQTAPPTPPASPAINLPRIGYRKRILPNGLTTYAVERHDTPTVAIQVWYKVGSKNDPPGRSGFAHLFEHLMFKSTRNVPSENMDRLTEDVGGENNAFTQDDVTVYHEVVPSNYLPTLLWAEADRMANLQINAANFHSERAVVEEEFRQTVLADPYGRLDELLIPHYSFANDAYRRPTIGSIEDLEKASLADVQQFHADYYRPDNAIVVIVGDFDPSRLDTFIDRYLAHIPQSKAPLATLSGAEPPRATGPRRFDEAAPSAAPLPEIVETYLLPGQGDPDAPALRIADSLLSGGESARLYQSLVYEKQIASSVNSGAEMRMDAGIFTLNAVAAGGKKLDDVQAALFAEIERLKTDGPTPEELEKARNQRIAAALHARETNEGLAMALGGAATLSSDPERINTDVQTLAAVSADDIKRVLAKYLTDANRVEIRYAAPTAVAAPSKGAAKK